MEFTTRITPDDPFPFDLTTLRRAEVEVLNSKLHRQLDVEYLAGGPDPETAARYEEVTAELDRRTVDAAHHTAHNSSIRAATQGCRRLMSWGKL